MHTFTVEQTPAEIVKAFPKAGDLFNKHEINFCCKGDRPFQKVITEKSLDEEGLLSDLNTAYEKWTKEDHKVVDWDALPLAEVTEHIFDKHHTFLHEELAPIGQFVTRVYSRHGADQPHLKEMYDLYHEFKLSIEEHMANEEADVFPLIEAYEKNPTEQLAEQIHQANEGLKEEREKQVELLIEMRKVTNDFTLPVGACNTYRITYARLEELAKDTEQHIHLENNILFERI